MNIRGQLETLGTLLIPSAHCPSAAKLGHETPGVLLTRSDNPSQVLEYTVTVPNLSLKTYKPNLPVTHYGEAPLIIYKPLCA